MAKKRARRRSPLRHWFLLDVVADPDSRPIFLWAAFTIIVGSVLFHWLEGWSWLDAVYFSVITLTTVGYGDLTPTHPLSKLLVIFYVINGIVVLLALFDQIRMVRGRDIREAEESLRQEPDEATRQR